jgi:Family of unknown function (DUF5681)
MSEIAAGKQRGRPFAKGQSGNPGGKPKGARNRATMLAEKLMQDDVEGIVNAVLTAARAGDMAAARMILDRIAPTRKGRPVEFELPTIETTSDLVPTIEAVVSAMAAGELTPDEASAVAAVIDAKRRAFETIDIERRIAAMEQRERDRTRR